MNEQQKIRAALQHSIAQVVPNNVLNSEQLEDICAQLHLEKPSKPELGDWACPCFSLAKFLRQAPPQLASNLAENLREPLPDWKIESVGAYLNFRLPRSAVAASIMQQVALPDFGRNENLKGQKIMVEFSSPNTNKPLHLGHLRNNVLGEAISRILAANGAAINKVSIINDRGVHICKSMLAYQRFGCQNGIWETPESSQTKGDHLVGNYYVRFNDWCKDVQKAAEGEEEPEKMALKMLKDWEDGKAEVFELWQKMRKWVLNGIAQTCKRCDISFDHLYFESETYKLGRELITEGLERGIFTRLEDGAIYADLSDYKLGQKVVQRSDGTSIYITQDLGTAVARHQDFPFDRQIYVVGNEQDYHFKVVIQILRLFGYPWSKQLYHLSYGMVVLPDGKMKSREGTVIDADVLLDQLEELAMEGLRERLHRGDSANPDSAQKVAQKIALAALHFYLLQFNPQREISFESKESLAFNGNTGPYLQYVCARIHSILKKSGNERSELLAERSYTSEAWDQFISSDEPVWELLKQLRNYPQAVSQAAAELNPSHVIKALAEVARCFSRFYHDVPILGSKEPLFSLRLDLCRATLRVLQNGMQLCVIPFLESM